MVLDEGLLAAVDEARCGVSRAEWIRAACREALGSGLRGMLPRVASQDTVEVAPVVVSGAPTVSTPRAVLSGSQPRDVYVPDVAVKFGGATDVRVDCADGPADRVLVMPEGGVSGFDVQERVVASKAAQLREVSGDGVLGSARAILEAHGSLEPLAAAVAKRVPGTNLGS
jgi:hypothetical protein